MINREMRPVTILTYPTGDDSYGQARRGTPTERVVDMVVKIYSQNNTTDVRYVDIDVIGLTYDKTITDKNEVVIDGIRYTVKYPIPSGRLTQILMKKVK